MNYVKLSLSAKVVLLFYFSVVRVALQRRGVAFLLAGAPPSHTPAASDHQLEHTWSPLHLLPHWFASWTWYMVTLRFYLLHPCLQPFPSTADPPCLTHQSLSKRHCEPGTPAEPPAWAWAASLCLLRDKFKHIPSTLLPVLVSAFESSVQPPTNSYNGDAIWDFSIIIVLFSGVVQRHWAVLHRRNQTILSVLRP